jgi:hypothetical protein
MITNRVIGARKNDTTYVLAAGGFKYVVATFYVHGKDLIPCVLTRNSCQMDNTVYIFHTLFDGTNIPHIHFADFLTALRWLLVGNIRQSQQRIPPPQMGT